MTFASAAFFYYRSFNGKNKITKKPPTKTPTTPDNGGGGTPQSLPNFSPLTDEEQRLLMQKVNQERAELNRKAQIEFHTAQEEERRLSEHRKKFLNSFLLPTTQMVGIFIRAISNNNDYITYYSTKIT